MEILTDNPDLCAAAYRIAEATPVSMFNDEDLADVIYDGDVIAVGRHANASQPDKWY